MSSRQVLIYWALAIPSPRPSIGGIMPSRSWEQWSHSNALFRLASARNSERITLSAYYIMFCQVACFSHRSAFLFSASIGPVATIYGTNPRKRDGPFTPGRDSTQALSSKPFFFERISKAASTSRCSRVVLSKFQKKMSQFSSIITGLREGRRGGLKPVIIKKLTKMNAIFIRRLQCTWPVSDLVCVHT